jgi:hypothetical protein
MHTRVSEKSKSGVGTLGIQAGSAETTVPLERLAFGTRKAAKSDEPKTGFLFFYCTRSGSKNRQKTGGMKKIESRHLYDYCLVLFYIWAIPPIFTTL